MSTYQIHIILDGENYETLNWANVPRVGERIMLKEHKGGEFFLAVVIQNTWGVVRSDMYAKWPNINMNVERLSK